MDIPKGANALTDEEIQRRIDEEMIQSLKYGTTIGYKWIALNKKDNALYCYKDYPQKEFRAGKIKGIATIESVLEMYKALGVDSVG